MAPISSFGAIHFNLAKQIAFIKGHGSQVFVYPVLQCSCLLDEQQFDPLCTSCGGTGRFYPPSAAYSTMLLLHQETSARTFLEVGTWIAGTIRATVLPGIRLCERDKVVWVDIRDTFNDEVLIYGLQDTVRFTFGVTLRLIADRQHVYQAGIDYQLVPPNTVSWLPGGQHPPFGGKYSCKYEAFPEYLIVQDSPRLRMEHRTEQAQEVLMMRLDKIDRP